MKQELFNELNKKYADVQQFRYDFWEECLLYNLIDEYNYHESDEYLEKSIKEIIHYMAMDDLPVFDFEEAVFVEWVESRPDIKEAVESYCKLLKAYNQAWNDFRNF